MASLRREISDYTRACERLMTDTAPFAQEELEWIEYYAAEMVNVADQRMRTPRPTVSHERRTLGEYAVTSRALLLADGLSEREKDLIRLLASEVTREILGKKAE